MKAFTNMNESHIERGAERYYDMFPEHMAAYERNALVGKINGGVRSSDVFALGQMLESYSNYQRFVENSGASLAELGSLPNVALDVITAVHSNSIVPLLASVQPIEEMTGIVYYKQITNGATGDVMYSHFGGQVSDPTFGASRQTFTMGAPLVETVSGITEYTATLKAPVMKGSISLSFYDANGAYQARIMDDNNGRILGDKCTGGINYTTGALELKFVEDPAATWKCTGFYDVDAEKSEGLQTINSGLISKPVRAEFFGLTSETGLLQEFSFQKRFGKIAEDETAADLTAELTATINAAVISRLDAAKRGNSIYTKAAPAGVSAQDHKASFVDALAAAESTIVNNAGRGSVNRLVCGANAATLLRGMPDFTLDKSGNASKIGLYGEISGIPVIRASGVVANDSITAVYTGSGTYDAPIIYSPYLPLFQTGTLQLSNNPLRNSKSIATMAALEVVVPQYITNIQIV